MSRNAWIIFAALCIAVLGGLVIVSRGNQINVSGVDETKIIAASAQNGEIADHVLGTTTGKATLIEYGDFQCPACKSAYPNVKDLTTTYKDQLVFIFRNLPLTSIHPNARAGAAAAEAAGLQGKYWEMHDKLYEQQDTWSTAATDQRTAYLVGYAQTIGVKDVNKFKADLDSKAVSDKINFDLALANKIKASATPTILLNGKQIESDTWADKTKFEAAIKDALQIK